MPASSPGCAGWCAPALRAAGHGSRRPRSPACRSGRDTKQRTDGQADATVNPRLEVLPAPVIHADLAALVALPMAHEDRATPSVEVGLREREHLADAKTSAPQHHDERARSHAYWRRSGLAHHGHDLFDLRPSADRPDSAGPCCAAGDRSGSREASLGSDGNRRHRATAKRSWAPPWGRGIRFGAVSTAPLTAQSIGAATALPTRASAPRRR
jgi:hypothetical protein